MAVDGKSSLTCRYLVRVYTLRFRKGHRGHLPVGMLSTARVAEGSDKGNLFLIL
jgi:hypothetical protein